MKRTKKSMFRAGLALALSLSLSLSLMITPVSAEFEDLTDTSIYECVGELTENFDELADVNALYYPSGNGVLSGTWQRSTRGKSGSASVADGALNITEPEGNGMWHPFSGVDFVFDKPLTPDYIVEVSYEITSITDGSTGNPVDTAGAVFFNNLSEPDAELKNVNSIGAGWWDAGSFQFFKAVENYKPESKGWIQRNGTSSVKTVYNLNNWTFDAAVTMGNGANSTVTALPIGPGSCDMNNTTTWQEEDKETFVSIPESTFSRLTFAVRQGTSVIDNISVKAYKFKDNIEPQMTETFTGKTAGAMTDTNVENGLGKWVANTAWGSGFEYAAYINAAGQEDIGVKASADQSFLQYVPGMNFSRLYANDNSEITVGLDFITPNVSERKYGWMIMEWGDGFTNKYRNIPFFAIIATENGYKFTRCAHDVNGNSENFGNEFVLLDQNQAYTFEAKIYPATEMTYATIKQGEDVVYSGFYRMGQWRACTDGHNVHTMSITEKWGTGGIILDNFKMSARAFSAESQLGKEINFNEFSNDGFLETIYWGSAKIAPAPANGETDMGNALNVVGEAEGVALPYFAEPVSEGV